jgi:crotonobetainyl-CoA:carnitine CoA-transferase CaiB-like acyl-CoA transferase
VRELSDALEVENLERRGMLSSYEHPRLGTVRGVGLPLRVSDFTPTYRPSPALGADASDLLTELGFDEAAVARLAAAGAFGRA